MNRLHLLFGLLVAISLLLSSCAKQQIENRAMRLEGVWQYNLVRECPLQNSFNRTDVTNEWLNDELEFILPDQVLYYDAETNTTWEGIWQILRKDSDEDLEFILDIALENPATDELVQQTIFIEWLTKQRLRATEYTPDKERFFRMEKLN